jgi:hypothetical protein
MTTALIVKNELAQSIGVFSIALIFFCILFVTGIAAMPGYAPFIATASIFLILVWYGKHYPAGKFSRRFVFGISRENYSPSVLSIPFSWQSGLNIQ